MESLTPRLELALLEDMVGRGDVAIDLIPQDATRKLQEITISHPPCPWALLGSLGKAVGTPPTPACSRTETLGRQPIKHPQRYTSNSNVCALGLFKDHYVFIYF